MKTIDQAFSIITYHITEPLLCQGCFRWVERDFPPVAINSEKIACLVIPFTFPFTLFSLPSNKHHKNVHESKRVSYPSHVKNSSVSK